MPATNPLTGMSDPRQSVTGTPEPTRPNAPAAPAPAAPDPLDWRNAGFSSPEYLQSQLADLSREQYQDYLTRFRPIETRSIQDYMSGAGMQERIGQATTDANTAWDSARGTTSRALSDSGISLDSQQEASRQRRYDQNRSASVANTTNAVRREEADREEMIGDALMGTGRGVEQTASSEFGSLGALATGQVARNSSAQAQAQANQQNQIIGAITTAAMIYFSDKKLKKNIKRSPDADALKDISDMPVSTYDYKEGKGLPEGRKVGPMWQDMPDDMKNPDGSVSIQNHLGKLTSAVRALNTKIEALEAAR